MTNIQRRMVSVILLGGAFVVFGAAADRMLSYLQHAGFRGLTTFGVLLGAFLVAYIAFTAILHFSHIVHRAVILHSSAAIITVIWLALVLARSTITESG